MLYTLLQMMAMTTGMSKHTKLDVHLGALAKQSEAPSVHAKVALDAKLSLLTEANAPNKRSKVQPPPPPFPPYADMSMSDISASP